MADATCTEPSTCKREGCEHTEGEANGHSFGEWEVVKEATTTEVGEKKRVCSACGETETEEIPVVEEESNNGEYKALAGCKGSIGGSLFGMFAMCLSLIVVKKKR
jgi:hypothetical protein